MCLFCVSLITKQLTRYSGRQVYHDAVRRRQSRPEWKASEDVEYSLAFHYQFLGPLLLIHILSPESLNEQLKDYHNQFVAQ